MKERGERTMRKEGRKRRSREEEEEEEAGGREEVGIAGKGCSKEREEERKGERMR